MNIPLVILLDGSAVEEVIVCRDTESAEDTFIEQVSDHLGVELDDEDADDALEDGHYESDGKSVCLSSADVPKSMMVAKE